MIRVLLADDHTMLRDGLRGLLGGVDDVQVVGDCADGHAAVRAALDTGPDVVVMDVGLPGLNGVDATRRIVAERPDIRVVMLTMYDDPPTVDRALRAGARGYVLKGAGIEQLCHAIRTVAAGEVYLSAGVSDYVLQGYLNGVERSDPLTPREREVLQLFAEGATSAEIAATLGIKTKTVQNVRTTIMDKLGVRTTAGLVRYAMRVGLVSV